MAARKVDPKRLAAMWKRGVIIADICKEFGCTRSAVKENVARYGLPKRSRGWKPKGYGERMSAILKGRVRGRYRERDREEKTRHHLTVTGV